MKYGDIFNRASLNIFTDASIQPMNDNTFKGCYGCVVVKTDDNTPYIIDSKYNIEDNTTNNRCELKAILFGLREAVRYRNDFSYINLFSDSRISVQGLKEWIFNWVNNRTDGVMYGSGKPVSNQDIIFNILNFIISNDLMINIYHQKGHVDNTQKSLENAQRVFMQTNKINSIDLDLVSMISQYNNYIDQLTRQKLYENENDYLNYIIDRNMNDIDIKYYKKLIKGGI